MLDLDYPEDSACDTDMNVVMTGAGGFVEIQGTAEGAPFSREEMAQLLALAEQGITELVALQRQRWQTDTAHERRHATLLASLPDLASMYLLYSSLRSRAWSQPVLVTARNRHEFHPRCRSREGGGEPRPPFSVRGAWRTHPGWPAAKAKIGELHTWDFPPARGAPGSTRFFVARSRFNVTDY